MKEKVEDTINDTVGKTINVITRADGKAISMTMHLHGIHSNRCIRPTVNNMAENGNRLSKAAIMAAMPTPGRPAGTPGMDQMGIHGPVNNSHEEKGKRKREINIIMPMTPRERTRGRARTGTETITRRPRGGHLKTTMKIGAHGRAASSTSPICRT